MITIEVLCGSLEDCLTAQACGADRIELNNATQLGGLTPSMGVFIEAKKHISIPIVVMIRPRSGGFFYSQEDYQTMFRDAMLFLEAGADGIVFGFLNEDRTVDVSRTQAFVDLAHSYQKEAVFHRALDRSLDIYEAVKTLISCNVDRVLTSGGEKTAPQGVLTLKRLIDIYGTEIEILPGSGITELNMYALIQETGANQIHGSFKTWIEDPTSTAMDKDSGGFDESRFFKVSIEALTYAVRLARPQCG